MRIWQLHFTRNNHQQTGQRCHKEKSFDLLTTRQAKEIFKWYTDDIPARLDQLQKCIDADVNGTVQLTREKDSLRPSMTTEFRQLPF